jgi:hypothetical protein
MRPPRRPDKVEAFERRLVEYWFDERLLTICNNVEVEIWLANHLPDMPWGVNTALTTFSGFQGRIGYLAERPSDEEFVVMVRSRLAKLRDEGLLD